MIVYLDNLARLSEADQDALSWDIGRAVHCQRRERHREAKARAFSSVDVRVERDRLILSFVERGGHGARESSPPPLLLAWDSGDSTSWYRVISASLGVWGDTTDRCDKSVTPNSAALLAPGGDTWRVDLDWADAGLSVTDRIVTRWRIAAAVECLTRPNYVPTDGVPPARSVGISVEAAPSPRLYLSWIGGPSPGERLVLAPRLDSEHVIRGTVGAMAEAWAMSPEPCLGLFLDGPTRQGK
jgi:hypothetical protein